MLEIVEHAPGVVVEVSAPTREGLFAEAAVALVSVALDTDLVIGRFEYPLAASGIDWESLLVNWLEEVRHWTEAEHVAFRQFKIHEISPVLVRVTGVGEPRDHLRHPARLTIKGVKLQLQAFSSSRGHSSRIILNV